MYKEDAFEPLPFELPLPRENAADEHWQGRERRHKEIPEGRRCQRTPFRPLRHKIKSHSRDKQGDREMNQDHVLRVFRKQRRLEVEGLQGLFSLTARCFCGSFSGESSRSRKKSLPC